MVRPETVRDRKTKEVAEGAVAGERGRAAAEAPAPPGRGRARSSASWTATSRSRASGIAAGGARAAARTSLTHVVHCAASVSFDDPYETSFRANVLGCRNALALLEGGAGRRRARRSWPTSRSRPRYIHGRRKRTIAQESALVFPRALLQQLLRAHEGDGLDRDRPRPRASDGLRVTQLLPSIVIGHSRTGQQPRRHQGA